MQSSISVVLCCYNSRNRIYPTIKSLLNQESASHVQWEVLLIDNGSTDNTSEYVKSIWSLDSNVPLRIIKEPQPGQLYARLTGAKSAMNEIISFIDDDNEVENLWISKISKFFSDHPEISAMGGPSELPGNIEKPAWFDQVSKSFAVGEQVSYSGEIKNPITTLWGAGLNIRKSDWDFLHDDQHEFFLTGRAENVLNSGDDSEICYCLKLNRRKIYYLDNLKLKHHISPSRINPSYLNKLMTGMGASEIYLSLYKNKLDPNYKIHRNWIIELLAHVKYTLIEIIKLVLSGKNEKIVIGARLHFHRGYMRELIRAHKQRSRIMYKFNSMN